MDKIDKTESVILYGFITFYFISLVVNAIKAAFGLERLATHHWPLFAGLTLLGWAALTPAQKARAIVTFKRIFRTAAKVAQKAARTLLYYIRVYPCIQIFALFELLFEKNGKLRENIQSASVCTAAVFPSGSMIRCLKG